MRKIEPADRLYEYDCSSDWDDHIQSVQMDILRGQKIPQNKINLFLNYKWYFYHRNKDNITQNYYINLFKKYAKFLDSSPKDFISSFSGNYAQKVFELIMANFLHNAGFEMRERSEEELKHSKKKEKGIPDIESSFRGQPFFIESTSVNTSCLDKFVEFLPKFEKFLKIAQYLKQRYDADNITPGREWYFGLPNLFASEKVINPSVFESMSFEEFEMMAKIFHCGIYTGFQLNEIIPDEISIPINFLFKNNQYSTPEWMEDVDWLAKRIATIIRQKLKKGYSEKEVPVIIAVSFVPSSNSFGLFSKLNDFFEQFSKNFETELHNAQNMENLYAVVINSTAYDWSPQNETNENQNTFFVIYNKNCKLVKNKTIFSSVIDPKRTYEIFLKSTVLI